MDAMRRGGAAKGVAALQHQVSSEVGERPSFRKKNKTKCWKKDLKSLSFFLNYLSTPGLYDLNSSFFGQHFKDWLFHLLWCQQREIGKNGVSGWTLKEVWKVHLTEAHTLSDSPLHHQELGTHKRRWILFAVSFFFNIHCAAVVFLTQLYFCSQSLLIIPALMTHAAVWSADWSATELWAHFLARSLPDSDILLRVQPWHLLLRHFRAQQTEAAWLISTGDSIRRFTYI